MDSILDISAPSRGLLEPSALLVEDKYWAIDNVVQNFSSAKKRAEHAGRYAVRS